MAFGPIKGTGIKPTGSNSNTSNGIEVSVVASILDVELMVDVPTIWLFVTKVC